MIKKYKINKRNLIQSIFKNKKILEIKCKETKYWANEAQILRFNKIKLTQKKLMKYKKFNKILT